MTHPTAAEQGAAPDRLSQREPPPFVSVASSLHSLRFRRRVSLSFCCGARLGCVCYNHIMELSEVSGHDNVLISYCVDASKKQICLHTGTYPYANPEKFQDFIFTDVVAYHFECDLFSNIVYDIAEVTLESIHKGYNEYFQRLNAEGWPMVKIRYQSSEELLAHLHEQNIRAYELSATMGLRGWIWAQACAVKESAPA